MLSLNDEIAYPSTVPICRFTFAISVPFEVERKQKSKIDDEDRGVREIR
jgi:hypothetical protein